MVQTDSDGNLFPDADLPCSVHLQRGFSGPTWLSSGSVVVVVVVQVVEAAVVL